ncbi:protein adenylyltransferase SelO [Aliamphritea hakodatensis]|uniref:protein adenylyltransferase SelO n=1 Tax=Aliamphritea hakodatensis TaxID=2895352 RepID=UPI0022FD587D|nr:YdiU family protein [Aliamphritea hakodatensis]
MNTSLTNLKFSNRFAEQLPADPVTENYCRQVESACFSYVNPTQVQSPKTLALSSEVLESLGIIGDTSDLLNDSAFSEILTGNKLLPGMKPYASCYGGHQFGNWAGQLGDGRAINLGEASTENGFFTLQLKGAGMTPYSRRADGLAVLRSSVREFLCSEAMHHLGIPTTRALSLCLTGESVTRDMFYDGNPQQEPGAIVCRVAESFTRFGHFQLYSSRNDIALLQQFTDYTLKNDFPHLGKPGKDTYLEWFSEVCDLTLSMIVHWQRVGFVHGVMNTDNMSVLGQTIDYGPYGWLDNYDPDWTPNTTDAQNRRYRFGNQAQISLWNLYQLANAIYPLIGDAKPLEEILNSYSGKYQSAYYQMMCQKLGLNTSFSDSKDNLINSLEKLLTSAETDMTIFYRVLANTSLETDINGQLITLKNAYYESTQINDSYIQALKNWLNQYQKICAEENLAPDERAKQMNTVNPKYILRNYLAQQASDKATEGDLSMLHALQEMIRNPYSEQPQFDEYAAKRPDWARTRPGCSMLSCSS